jgi:N6-adenosine-specific RNA methylase IME4
MSELIINPEFRDLIPALTDDEFKGLEESIKKEGCRDSIITWNNIIIDGHNRYNICSKFNIPYKVYEMKFDSKDDVIDWMYTNQLSRRNLTDEKKTYLIGKQYEFRKKRIGAPIGNINAIKQSNQSDYIEKPKEKTIEVMAKENNVGQATIQRAAEYSKAVDTVVKNVGVDTLRQKILNGEVKLTKKDTIALASTSPENQTKVMSLIDKGEAKTFQDAKRVIAADNVKEIPQVKGKYKIVLADPPWEYGGSMNITYGTADKHYPTMSLDKICSLPIKELSEDNAVLFLWTTSPLLEDSFKVINSWGFKYKASFIWDKVKHVMGHYNSVRHEFLLVATKGSCTPEVMKLHDSVVSIERIEHSAKPEVFREYIDEIYPSGARIELFARTKVSNWDSWGNQV